MEDDKLARQRLTFGQLLGPSGVLSTENSKTYKEMREKLIVSLRPRNFLELLMVRQVLNETWKILRYQNNQSIGIERRFRESLAFQDKRAKALKARKEAIAKEAAEKSGQPVTELQRLIDLEIEITSSLQEADDILARPPTEFDHNRALEAGIVFHEQLDRLINGAMRRRNDALEQLELYREGLGKYWRMTADELLAAGIVVEPPPPPPERFSVEELFADVETHSGDPPEEGRAPPDGSHQEALAPSEPSKADNASNGSRLPGDDRSVEAPGLSDSSEGSDLLDGVVLEGGETEFQEFLD